MDNVTSAFETSATTEKLDAALAKAQAEVETASKDKTNPAFGAKAKYADLASLWAACRQALTSNGVSVTQWPIHSGDGRLHILTRLACAGEWMRAHFSLPVSKADAHGYGSATTYAKRIALSAAVGIVADEDDDGNGAAGYDKGGTRTNATPAPPAQTQRTAPPPSAPRAHATTNGNTGPRTLSAEESRAFDGPSAAPKTSPVREPGADDEPPTLDDVQARIARALKDQDGPALEAIKADLAFVCGGKKDHPLVAVWKGAVKAVRDAQKSVAA